MKKQWMLGILYILFCAAAVLADPAETRAAASAGQSAYRAVFDASYYYNANPDVAAVCGKDEETLFLHFVTFGVYEGRSASAEFNPQIYRQRYTDLQQVFGNDMAAYCQHYVSFGRREGRNAASGEAVTISVKISAKSKDSKSVNAETKKEMTETAEEEKETAIEKSQEKKESVEEKKTAETADSREKASISEDDMNLVGAAAAEETKAGEIIGTYTTIYEENVSRATNVKVGASRINGVVLQPGEKFSFNKTVLARTEANGYAEGPVFVKGKEVSGIGGGVCQVSSTLYAAMLEAKLPATERHPHSMAVDYVPKGMDATIAGDYLDLKFTNVFSRPLQIQASAQGGSLTVTLVLQ